MISQLSSELATEKYDLEKNLGSLKYWSYRKAFEIFGFDDGYRDQLSITTELSVHQLKIVLFKFLNWLPNHSDTLVWIENFSLSNPSLLQAVLSELGEDGPRNDGNVIVVGKARLEGEEARGNVISDRKMDLLLLITFSCIVDDLDFKVFCPESSDHIYFIERQLFAASCEKLRKDKLKLELL